MSAGNDEDRVTCSNPVDVEILADYWLGRLSDSEEEPVEVHLLECDRCGDRLQEVIALAEGLRRVAQAGALRVVVSDTFVIRAREDGLRVREYAARPGGSVACTVTADDDLLIARLAADMSGARRVDLSICDEDGVEQARLPDIPVRTDEHGVALQESMTYAKAAPDNTMLMRLIAVDDAGGEHVVGEYTFNHTRSMPGPGSW